MIALRPDTFSVRSALLRRHFFQLRRSGLREWWFLVFVEGIEEEELISAVRLRAPMWLEPVQVNVYRRRWPERYAFLCLVSLANQRGYRNPMKSRPLLDVRKPKWNMH
jgi:hypothetical protein